MTDDPPLPPPPRAQPWELLSAEQREACGDSFFALNSAKDGMLSRHELLESLKDAGYDHDTAVEAAEEAMKEFGGGKEYMTLEDYVMYVAGGLLMKANKWADIVVKFKLNSKTAGLPGKAAAAAAGGGRSGARALLAT